MAQVNWMDGNIDPPQNGRYYITIERLIDSAYFKKGDIEIYEDRFDSTVGFESIGRNNPSWKVVAWADKLYPDAPKEYAARLKTYFGSSVKR